MVLTSGKTALSVLGLGLVGLTGYADAFSPPSVSVSGNAMSARLGAVSTSAPSSSRSLLSKLSMEAEPFSKADVDRLKKSRDLSHLFDGNAQWKSKKLAQDPEFFKESAKGQTPAYLWIGASPPLQLHPAGGPRAAQDLTCLQAAYCAV